jgi:hypothetical protein
LIADDLDAMLFSVGLRFPSIRVKKEDKKKAKKAMKANHLVFIL